MILNDQRQRAGLLLGLLAVAAFSPNLAWLIVDHRPEHDATLGLLLFGLAGVSLLLFISSRLWIGAVLLMPWAILAPFEFFYIVDFGRSSDTHLLGVLAETNVAEASAFLSGRAGLLLGASLCLGLLAAIAVGSVFRARFAWNGLRRYWLLMACLLILIAPEALKGQEPVPMAASPSVQATTTPSLGASLVDTYLLDFFEYLQASYPTGVPRRILAYLEYRRALRVAKDQLGGFRFHASQEQINGRQVYVLVIGETARPDRWQLNGYARQTMPRLAQVDGLVSFHDVFSPWDLTCMSVPIILTRKPASDADPLFLERSLISAFKEAGFRTYWLSTQSPLGPYDSTTALYASEAHEVHYLNLASYKGAGTYDGALLGALDEVLRRGEQRVLVVLHTLGGHFNYADRYPDNFDIFRPSLKGVGEASLHDRTLQAELNNSYDNSVLYLDHFLAEVISRLSATNSISGLFYIADHGENLFDGACDKAGHGRGNEYDFRVPALWWNSRHYAAMFPEKVAAVRARVDSPLATSNVFYSLLDAAGIHYPAWERAAALSIFDAHWHSSRRLTHDGIDFDQAPRDRTCRKVLSVPRPGTLPG